MTIETNWCTVKIDDKGIYALMCLKKPSGDESVCISESFINDFLREQGIVYGLCEAAIHALSENIMYGQYLCVAQGKPALRGPDGYYEYQKDTKDMKKKPLVLEDGSVDYKNSLTLANISEGELLAIYVPAAEGTDGTDVFGNDVRNPGPGRELMPLRGKGIVAGEDKIHYYAGYGGHIVIDGNRVSIEKLYSINGELNIEVGNVRFEGDVEVNGDVRSGMEIEAGGNIYIHGHVGACRIDAGGNITIEKGIQGRDDCLITAKGDVACKFVEKCRIVAEGNIYADSVMNATLTSNRHIVVSSKTGSVIGSAVYGMLSVTAKEAGNCAGTRTVLKSGLPMSIFTRAGELKNTLKDLEEKITALEKHQAVFEENVLNSNHNLTEKQVKDERTKMMRAKILLNSQKKSSQDELEVLNARIEEADGKTCVNITGAIHEGVRVYIGDSPYTVTEAVREVTYVLRNGVVEATELIENTD